MSVKINVDKCVGCEACVAACPFGAISMKDGVAVIGDACTQCGACVEVCPAGAIERIEEPKAKSAQDGSGVWVFAEQRHGKISSMAYELLGEGRKLADKLGQPLAAVLLGHNMQREAEDLLHYGADMVYLVDDPRLAEFHDDSYSQALC